MSSASSNGTWIAGDWVKYRRSFGLHGYRLRTNNPLGLTHISSSRTYEAKVWQNSYGGWEGTVTSPTGEIRTSGWNRSRRVLMRHTRRWDSRSPVTPAPYDWANEEDC